MAYISISKALTGHTYFGSPYECFDNCGTCDGARCHRCKERYRVEDVETGKVRYCVTKEEAEVLAKEWELNN